VIQAAKRKARGYGKKHFKTIAYLLSGKLDLQHHVPSVPTSNKVVSSNPAHGEVYLLLKCPTTESERLCICVQGILILRLSTILCFIYSGIVPTALYFLFFSLLIRNT
jgi:hypothetical protein